MHLPKKPQNECYEYYDQLYVALSSFFPFNEAPASASYEHHQQTLLVIRDDFYTH